MLTVRGQAECIAEMKSTVGLGCGCWKKSSCMEETAWYRGVQAPSVGEKITSDRERYSMDESYSADMSRLNTWTWFWVWLRSGLCFCFCC